MFLWNLTKPSAEFYSIVVELISSNTSYHTFVTCIFFMPFFWKSQCCFLSSNMDFIMHYISLLSDFFWYNERRLCFSYTMSFHFTILNHGVVIVMIDWKHVLFDTFGWRWQWRNLQMQILDLISRLPLVLTMMPQATVTAFRILVLKKKHKNKNKLNYNNLWYLWWCDMKQNSQKNKTLTSSIIHHNVLSEYFCRFSWFSSFYFLCFDCVCSCWTL